MSPPAWNCVALHEPARAVGGRLTADGGPKDGPGRRRDAWDEARSGRRPGGSRGEGAKDR